MAFLIVFSSDVNASFEIFVPEKNMKKENEERKVSVEAMDEIKE
jgi:hypothetical protein